MPVSGVLSGAGAAGLDGGDSASGATSGGGAGWLVASGVTRVSGAALAGKGGSVVPLGGREDLAGELGTGADSSGSAAAALGEDAGAGGWAGTLTAGGGGCTCAVITAPELSATSLGFTSEAQSQKCSMVNSYKGMVNDKCLGIGCTIIQTSALIFSLSKIIQCNSAYIAYVSVIF